MGWLDDFGGGSSSRWFIFLSGSHSASLIIGVLKWKGWMHVACIFKPALRKYLLTVHLPLLEFSGPY